MSTKTNPEALNPAPDGNPTIETPDLEKHSGQVRMAARLARRYAGVLLYVTGIGWHRWDGTRWALDEEGHAERAVLNILRMAMAESVGGDDKLREDVIKCESASGIEGTLRIARSMPALRVTARDVDADPYLLNCANGTLDLRTRQLRPHDPADRITKITRGAYRDSLEPGEWDTFLARILPDTDERHYLQRVAGQACHGVVHEHLFPVLMGTGANGKGTAYGAMTNALGDYAVIINPDLLMAHRDGKVGGVEMMTLRGARLVVGSETEDGRNLDEATMKRLTGGDEITARYHHQNPVSWQPSHQLLYVTNKLPKVRGNDPAVWRRMRVIPFNVVLPEQEWDKELPERLKLHADAVLSWMAHGLWDYQDNGGMRDPDSVKFATHEYLVKSDAVRRFIQDRCFVSPPSTELTSVLHAAWSSWARLDGAEPLSMTAFAAELDRLEYPSKRTKRGSQRQGLTLYRRDDESAGGDGW